MAIIFEFEDGAEVLVERPADLDILMPIAKEWSEDGDGVVRLRDTEDGRIITELFVGGGALGLDWRTLRGAMLDEISSYYGDEDDWYSEA